MQSITNTSHIQLTINITFPAQKTQENILTSCKVKTLYTYQDTSILHCKAKVTAVLKQQMVLPLFYAHILYKIYYHPEFVLNNFCKSYLFLLVFILFFI